MRGEGLLSGRGDCAVSGRDESGGVESEGSLEDGFELLFDDPPPAFDDPGLTVTAKGMSSLCIWLTLPASISTVERDSARISPLLSRAVICSCLVPTLSVTDTF